MDTRGDTWLGPFEPRPASIDEVRRLAEAITAGGMNTKALEDARGAQWTKLIFNAATNPIGALTRLTHGRVVELAETRRLVTGLVDEGKAVADALGITLDSDPDELVDHAAEVAYEHRASMLQDVLGERATEIDALNGGIVRFGSRAGRADAAERGDRRPDQGARALLVSTLRPRLGPLISGCLVGLSISWNIANIGPVATLLAGKYGTSLAVIGLFTTVAFFAELAVMIPGGQAIDRFGAQRTGLLAIAISLVANLLLMLPANAVVALVLRWVVGLGVGLGFLAGAIYAQSDSRRSVALAGGIYGGVSLSGGGLALAVVPQLVPAFGWRAPYVSAAIVAAVAIPLVALGPPTPGHGLRRSGPGFLVLMADRRLMRLGLISSVSFGFSVILGNWVVTLLERTGGLTRGIAGAIGSLLLLFGIVGRPAGGLLVRGFPALTRLMLATSFVAGALGTAVIALSAGRVSDTLAAALAGLAAGNPVRRDGVRRRAGVPGGQRRGGRRHEHLSGAHDRLRRTAGRPRLRTARGWADRLRRGGRAVGLRAGADLPRPALRVRPWLRPSTPSSSGPGTTAWSPPPTSPGPG